MRKLLSNIYLETVGLGIMGAVFYLMAYYSEDNVTIVFLGAMGIVIFTAYAGGLRIVGRMRHELQRRSEELRYLSKNYDQTPWQRLYEGHTLFREVHLRNLFETYMAEMKKLPGGADEAYRYDIADYINLENLEEKANTKLLNQVGDILTGLGILGTFLGLILGLKDFDTSGNDAMIASIPPLVDGIKIAFYTSIYGISFSLIYNVILKMGMTKLSTAVDRFVHSYYQNVMPVPENDAFNLLLKYQKTQADSIEEFTEVLANKMADSFRRITTPTFQKMIDSMDDITGEVTKCQTEGMGKVVDAFLDEMNQSLNGQFREVARTSRNLCTWQKNMMTDVGNTLTEIKKSGQNVAKVNQDTAEIMKSINLFMEKMNQYNLTVNEIYQTMTKQGSDFYKISEEQKHTLEMIRDHEQELMKTIGELKDTELMAASCKESKNGRRKMFGSRKA